jgi:hypothetical protein
MSRVGINTHPRKDTDLGLLTQTSFIIHYMGWQGATGFRDHTGISRLSSQRACHPPPPFRANFRMADDAPGTAECHIRA